MFFRLFSIFNKQAEQGLDRGFIPADHRQAPRQSKAPAQKVQAGDLKQAFQTARQEYRASQPFNRAMPPRTQSLSHSR